MPFHVELKVTTMRHARAFNLSREELLRSFIEPWMADRKIELGDQEWLPRESSLRVLEGPRLEGPDLSFGQGWSNAERSARDVTRQVIAEAERNAPPAPVAVAVDGESMEEAIAALAAGDEPRPLELAEAQEAIDRRDPEVAAVIIVTRRQPEPGRRRS
ncbi:MAG: hypothetical protein ACHQCF_00115 [Solirubrobacterales bacterium]